MTSNFISTPIQGIRTHTTGDLQEIGSLVVDWLLREDSLAAEEPILEASVHRPARGKIWVAAYTGPNGGQIWRSTGFTDRYEASLVARRWEAEAKAERARLGPSIRAAPVRGGGHELGGSLRPIRTQRQVAAMLGMSERGVRAVERRALGKLRRNPMLRQVWRRYIGGEL